MAPFHYPPAAMALLDRSTAAVFLVSLCALLWVCGASWADENLPPPQAAQSTGEVLVLHDGGVLTGKISRVGERYVVRRAGGEIYVPSASVLIACDRLEDAYEHRRAEMSRPSADAHLSLAEWCLRHGLLPQAARELIDAAGLEPMHPRIALFQRRLMASSKPQPREPVVPASHTQPVAAETTAAEYVAPLSENLPDGAVERFTRRVQPILVNNCTNSGCHQLGGKQKFQLDRSLLHGLSNRRTTTRNLAATLALVDRTQPQLSPLLSVPRQTHGGMSSPVFGPRQHAAFTHLVDWVALVTRSESSEQQSVPAAMQQAEILAENAPPKPAIANPWIEPKPDATQALYAEEVGPASMGERQQRYGAQLQSWQSKDEFDPEIFNRRQRSRIRAPERGDANSAIGNR